MLYAQKPTYTTFVFFFFNDTATTEIYTLSLHDALPISPDLAAAPQLIARTASSRISEDDAPLDGDELVRRQRSEEHTSELQSQSNLVCRLLLEKKKRTRTRRYIPLPHATFSSPSPVQVS